MGDCGAKWLWEDNPFKDASGHSETPKGHDHLPGLLPLRCSLSCPTKPAGSPFSPDCGDTISMGLFREVGVFQKYTDAQQEKIQLALEQVGLSSFLNAPLQALSGGQFQRVLFARLILQDAPVIFLDEPFTGVDMRTIQDLMTLMKSWVKEGRLVIAVLHDLDLVQDHFPQTLLFGSPFLHTGLNS